MQLLNFKYNLSLFRSGTRSLKDPQFISICLMFKHSFCVVFCTFSATHTHKGKKGHGGGGIITTAGEPVCHLSLRQPIREIRGGGGGETEQCRGGGSRGGRGFLEAQWSIDVSLSS